ncbi:MAG TPA: MFS transporter [Sphingomonadaceae bacterium]|nr:MFS transporter [Sphingomonadaceae bacterium]
MAAIGVCTAIYFLDGLIHTVLGPMAPEVSAELGLGPAALGQIFSANLIGQTIGLLAFPVIARRRDHRFAIILAVFGFSLAQFATAIAWDAWSLFAFRLVDGIFLGGCLPSCLAIVTRIAPKARLGLALMVLFTGYGSGATVSGILASAFLDNGGWRLAIGLVGATSAVTAMAAIVWLREPGRRPGPAETAVTGSRTLDVVTPGLLGGTLLLWLMFISMLTVQYCLSSWLPTLLVEVGRDQSFAALSVTIFSLGGIIAALGVGVLIDRFGGTLVLGAFLIIATVTLFLVGQSLATAPGWLLMLMLATGGFFFLGAYGGINYVLTTYYPDDLRAFGIGLTKSVSRLGTIVAPVIIGYGLVLGIAETTIMSLFAIPAALAALAVYAVGHLVRSRTL